MDKVSSPASAGRRMAEALRRIVGSGGQRSVVMMSTGAVVSQAVGLAVTPVITRIYSPVDYAALAVFGSITAIAAAAATAGYSAAIVLPPDGAEGDLDADSLVRLCFLISSALAVVALAAIATGRLLGADLWTLELGPWVYAIPIAILAAGYRQSLSSFATRRRDFGRLARIQPLSRVTSAAVAISAGLMGAGRAGLLVSALLTPLVGLGTLVRGYRESRRDPNDDGQRNTESVHRRVWAQAARYRDFPLLNMPLALLNAVAWNIQILVFSYYYAPEEIGQYALAALVVGLPSTVVLSGVNPVFLKGLAARASDRIACAALVRRTQKRLLAISIPAFLLLAVTGPWAFSWIFGENWEPAGMLAVAMIPMVWAQFMTTTLSSAFVVFRRQSLLLVWQIVAVAATVGSVAAAAAHGASLLTATTMMSCITAVLYLILYVMARRTITNGGDAE